MQLLVLALLIGDTAAGLASGLAGSLAFAATAILRALTQIAGLDGLNVFHDSNLHKKCSYKCYHILPPKSTSPGNIPGIFSGELDFKAEVVYNEDDKIQFIGWMFRN